MSILGSLIGDSILSATAGIKTIHVKVEQLAEIIDETFIQPASGQDFLNRVQNTIKGRKLFPNELESEDKRYMLYVSMFKRGLTEHRTVWVKAYETNIVYEWNGYTLGPIQQAVNRKLAMRAMRPFQPQPQVPPASPEENESGEVDKAVFSGTENKVPSSMAQAQYSPNSGSSSIVIRRVILGVAALVMLNVIVMALSAFNDKKKRSSDYNSSGTIGEEAYSYNASMYNSNDTGTGDGSSNSNGSSMYSQGSSNSNDSSMYSQGSSNSGSSNNHTGFAYSYGDDDDYDDDYDAYEDDDDYNAYEDEDDDYNAYEDEDEDDDDFSESEYIFPDSDTEKLTKADLQDKTAKELRIARNEIYARHGRLFDDEGLQTYFDEQSWYNGYISPSDFVDLLELNAIERRNAKFILKYENNR